MRSRRFVRARPRSAPVCEREGVGIRKADALARSGRLIRQAD
ncbi:MAG: hypothetical protein ACK5HA_13420 [Planctomycetaceae bacterium]